MFSGPSQLVSTPFTKYITERYWRIIQNYRPIVYCVYSIASQSRSCERTALNCIQRGNRLLVVYLWLDTVLAHRNGRGLLSNQSCPALIHSECAILLDEKLCIHCNRLRIFPLHTQSKVRFRLYHKHISSDRPPCVGLTEWTAGSSIYGCRVRP